MGNSASITLVVNPPHHAEPTLNGYHVAGGTISGVVYVDTNNAPSHNDTALVLYLKGQEDVRVIYTEQEFYENDDGERVSRQVKKNAYAKREIIHLSIPIVSEYDGFTGRFEYPFEIPLPSHLPTSMNHQGEDGHCIIKYKIKAETNSGYKQEYEIPIMGVPMPSTPVPHSVEPHTEAIKFCCCFDNGSITFGASVSDTLVARGDLIRSSFACKNEGTAEIQFVSAKLVERIMWRAGGNHSYTQNVLIKQNFQKTRDMDEITKDELEEINSANSDDSDMARGLEQTLMKELYNVIKRNENSLSLYIPYNAYHSYNGQCCEVVHTLEIKIKTEGGVTDLKVKIPVHIGTVSEHPPPPPIEEEEEEDQHFEPVVPLIPPSTWNAPEPTPPTPPPVFVPIIPSVPPSDWEPDVVQPPSIFVPPSNQVHIAPVVESEQEIHVGHPPGAPILVIVPSLEPSLQSLIGELRASVSASTTIKDRVKDQVWHDELFSVLTEREYVAIIGAVTVEFDQTEVADTIASVINEFTCDYIIAVIRSVQEWMRTSMIQRLLPYAVDLKENSDSILSELSEWETLNTKKYFTANLKN